MKAFQRMIFKSLSLIEVEELQMGSRFKQNKAKLKQGIAELLEHVEIFEKMLKEKSVSNHNEQMVFGDFITGVQELQMGLEDFLEYIEDNDEEYELKSIWDEVLKPYIKPAIDKLGQFESFHRKSSNAEMAVREVSATLHSILYQAEELIKKY